MTPAFRLGLALALLLAVTDRARAQPAVAPAPHPTLDELVKEYKHWGLPLPSTDAKLVLLTWGAPDSGRSWLAFRHTPRTGEKDYRYLSGARWEKFDSRPTSEEVFDSRPSITQGRRIFGMDWLCFAVQCKVRGWDALADAAYERARNDIRKPSPAGFPESIVLASLRGTAAWFWEQKLTERHSDRKKVLTHLDDRARAGGYFENWNKDAFRSDLASTVAPRKSKPGSIAELIDGLTDHWDDPEDWDNEAGQTAYWKLVELGFDAVPALIEHLEDRRLTRTATRSIKEPSPRIVRVGELGSGLLDGLSDGALSDDDAWWFFGKFGNPGAAKKWWATAQRTGEEKWLLDRALLARDNENVTTPLNRSIIRAIAVKYPHRLPALYQTVLLKRPALDSKRLALEIATSRLGREKKVALLEEGVTGRDPVHRYHALAALSVADPEAFAKALRRTLANYPKGLRFEHGRPAPELGIVGLANQTDDRVCWESLSTLTRDLPAETRLRFLEQFGWRAERHGATNGRNHVIRYLVSYLDDRAVGATGIDQQEAVRDRAATQLAYLFEVESWLTTTTSPRELSLLRMRVRELAERELARAAK